ncbi:hypothetical protein NM208_g4854 [Fusarium decemcellulare]|uniref:Uncharacterized protein n=1 Tax=Fusarium decemcellulare TaxID=57161 RepID=A0ACC1SJ40_9HYPO|nr:hypothetical protein NM208_g4854 [Fusarium decemcellulare]
MAVELRKLGKLAYRDTGPVADSSDYTTVVIIHGLGFHSANFIPMLPFAATHNSRLVIPNRREYPGSEPYTTEEGHQLEAVQEAEDGKALLDEFMRDRAHEIFDFLTEFVQQEKIPFPGQNQGGGIILVAWSLGAIWLMPFLLHAPSFPVGEVDIREYVRHAIIYDSPYTCFAYPPPEDAYLPLRDESIPPEDRAEAFSRWVSGYYTHGPPTEHDDGLERRIPAQDRRSTIDTTTKEQIEGFFDSTVAGFEGSDILHAGLGLSTGLNAELCDRVFYLPQDSTRGFWETLQIVYLCCDRSVYEMPWAALSIQNQLKEAEQLGRKMRNISIVIMKGANHFAHWDEPERLMQQLLEAL